MADGNTPLFNPTTGEVSPIREEEAKKRGACPRCVGLMAEVQAVQNDLELSEREVRRLRRSEGALKAELRERQRQAKERPYAVEVFDYWVEQTGRDPNRVKLGEKREKAVLARLREGYDAEYLKRAVDGLVLGAYVDEQKGTRYDDLELMCRNEVNVERFHGVAETGGRAGVGGWTDGQNDEPTAWF